MDKILKMRSLPPYIIFPCFFIPLFGFGQSVSIELISSGGGTAINPSVSFSYSIGESIVTADNTSLITNAGFQQGVYLLTSIGSILNENSTFLVSAYPNPTTDILNFRFQGNVSFPFDWVIEVFSSDAKKLNVPINNQDHTVSLANLANGIYFITIGTTQNRQVFKVVKTY